MSINRMFNELLLKEYEDRKLERDYNEGPSIDDLREEAVRISVIIADDLVHDYGMPEDKAQLLMDMICDHLSDAPLVYQRQVLAAFRRRSK